MLNPRSLALAASMLALAACNPFHRDPVTSVSRDTNVNDRWAATLVTPAALAGAVQMNGTAFMQPGQNSQNTDVPLHQDRRRRPRRDGRLHQRAHAERGQLPRGGLRLRGQRRDDRGLRQPRRAGPLKVSRPRPLGARGRTGPTAPPSAPHAPHARPEEHTMSDANTPQDPKTAKKGGFGAFSEQYRDRWASGHPDAKKPGAATPPESDPAPAPDATERP